MIKQVDLYIYLDAHGVAQFSDRPQPGVRYRHKWSGKRAHYFVSVAPNHDAATADHALGFECMAAEIRLGGNARDVYRATLPSPRKSSENGPDDEGRIQGRLI